MPFIVTSIMEYKTKEARHFTGLLSLEQILAIVCIYIKYKCN